MEKEKNTKRPADYRKLVFFNVLSALAVIAALAWVLIVYFHLWQSEFTNDAQVEAYINPVNTRIPGYIRQVGFSEHQHVKKGDTLVTIDDRDYLIALKLARANLLDAQAGRGISLSGQGIANTGVEVSEANIEEVKANLDNAERNLNRYENLVKDDAATQFDLDRQKSQRDALLARYKSLLRVRQVSQLGTAENRHRVASSDANILRAEAALDQALLNLSYTVIRAPYDGVLGRKIIEEGQYVVPGQSLVSIVRGDERWITANYTESQLMALKLGGRVEIRVDAIPGKIYFGKIVALSEASGSRYSAVPVDNATGNFVKIQQRFPVKIALAGENKPETIALLRAGMNVEVESIRESAP